MVTWDLFQTKSNILVRISFFLTFDENFLVEFQLKSALKCLTVAQIQSIAQYTFVHNRAVWKGFPDLFVWNPSNKICKVKFYLSEVKNRPNFRSYLKFVEVKSHNDRLSFHQIVWLNQLTQWKINCEVCKVNGKILKIFTELKSNFFCCFLQQTEQEKCCNEQLQSSN